MLTSARFVTAKFFPPAVRAFSVVMSAPTATDRKYCDIGVNLTDGMFRGNYHGSQAHADDFNLVLERARTVGVKEMIVTAGCLEDVKECLALCAAHEGLYTTVGVHPTRCNEFLSDPEGHMAALIDIGTKGKASGKIVAVGEFGLDWDRTKFCSKEVQLQYFEAQFVLVDALQLPLFLHSRSTEGEFIDILRRNRERIRKGGVVHSFTGSVAEMEECVALGFHIGINGCSLKTAENLAVAAKIPLDKLLLETDAPWCEIRPTHASFPHVKTTWKLQKKEKFVMGDCVRGRCEPCHIVQVAEVMAALKGVTVDELATTVYANTRALFFPDAELELKDGGK